MSDSIDTSDILVVVDTGDQINVSLQPPDQYGISIQSGDTYIVNIDLPTTVVTTNDDHYYKVSDFAVSASYSLTASYVEGDAGIIEWDEITNKPSGIVSSSMQVDYTQLQNIPTIIPTASFVEFDNIANKPSLVSSSTQINTGSFSGSFLGAIAFSETSSYIEFANVANKPELVSSSQQIVEGINNQIITPAQVTASIQSNTIAVSTNSPNTNTIISSSVKSNIFNATEILEPPIPIDKFIGTSVEYTAQRETAVRSGFLIASWSGSSITYTDVSNADVGDTSDLSFNFIRVGDTVLLRAYSAGIGSGAWTVQVLFKMFPNLL